MRGGHVIVVTCLSAAGMGSLVFIEGIMNKMENLDNISNKEDLEQRKFT